MSVVAMAVGAGLVVGPARSLATGETFHWLARVALGGQLLTGLVTLLAGMGIFLLMPSYRRFLQLAFVGSVAPAGAFIYQTILYAQKMRLASAENQELYALKVSGGVQISLMFLGVFGLLFYLLRTRRLKSMLCYGGPGALGSSAVGAVMGGSLAYLAWLLCRYLGFSKDIGWSVKAINAVTVDYFVLFGALLGALAYGYIGWRRPQTRLVRGPVAGGAIGLAVGSGLGYGAWWLCRWLGYTKGIAWFATVLRGSRMEYFIAGGALLLAAVSIYRGMKGGGGSGLGAGRRPVQRATTMGTGTRSGGMASTRGTPGMRSPGIFDF